MEMAALLEELTAIPALSGYEDAMIQAMVSRFQGLADEVQVDRVGNVTATLRGEDGHPSLLVFAHMDELGLVVRKIEADGFLRFERVGGVPEKSLLGAWVEIHTSAGDSVPGIIGTTSHHVTSPEEKFRVPNRLEMYIDVGCSTAAEVEERGIRVGDWITYRPSFARLSEDRVAAKALDNRVGCAILLRSLAALAGQRPQATVHFVASVQEEFNVRGVWPAFHALKPDAAICLDVTIACDTPELTHLSDVRLGRGPALGMYEFHGRGTLGGLIPHPMWRRFLESVADREGIHYQREVLLGIITDASFSQLLGETGTPMAAIAVPARYTHAPVESCSLADIQVAEHWVVAAAQRFDAAVDLRRGAG
jgi:putative aminopeptidase FrvX